MGEGELDLATLGERGAGALEPADPRREFLDRLISLHDSLEGDDLVAGAVEADLAVAPEIVAVAEALEPGRLFHVAEDEDAGIGADVGREQHQTDAAEEGQQDQEEGKEG